MVSCYKIIGICFLSVETSVGLPKVANWLITFKLLNYGKYGVSQKGCGTFDNPYFGETAQITEKT